MIRSGPVLFAISVLALPASTQAAAQTGPGARPVSVPAAVLDVELPAEVWQTRIQSLHGDVVPLERFRGRTIVLNVWATWCAPCVAELRSFEALRTHLGAHDVVFVFLSPERARSVERFVRVHGYTLPFYLEYDELPDVFGVRGLPTTLIIDPAGVLRLKVYGARDWAADGFVAALKRLARGVPPG